MRSHQPFSDGAAGTSLTDIEQEIAATQARLQQLLAQKSRVETAAAPSMKSPELGLYAWQEAALEAWHESSRHGVVQAVTGAGKTRVGVAAIAEALSQSRRTVVITPTRVLADQWTTALRELLPGAVLARTIKPGAPWQVLVTTVQTAMARPLLAPGESGLLVADECHRYGAGQFSLALRQEYEWRLGLTATLRRDDEGDRILSSYFGTIVHDLGYGEALADDLIAPFKFAFVSVPLSPDERAEYDTLTVDLRRARSQLVMQHAAPEQSIGEFLAAVSRLAEDRTPGGGGGLARFYMARFAARKKLLAGTGMKQRALEALSPAVKASMGSIVFTQTKESSDQSAETLRQRGCSAAAVHADLHQDEREERIELFRTRSVMAIAAPRILDEGVDVPEADLGIVLASNRSRRQMIQRLGRVLRRRPNKLARFVVLYAAHSVEDPFDSEFIPDFYEDCLPFAMESQRFDLAVQRDLPALLQFLGVGRDHADTAEPFSFPQHTQAHPEPSVKQPIPVTQQALSIHASEPVAVRWLPPPGARAFEDADLVKAYLAEVAKYPLLSREEHTNLAQRIEVGLYAEHLLSTGDPRFAREELADLAQEGRAAKTRFICCNLRLVVSLAKRYTGRGLEFLDLIQEGNIGLIRSVEKFDYKLGNAFSTYATWWIKQALTRGMADYGRLIRVPVHFDEVVRRVEHHRSTLDMSWAQLLRTHPDGIEDLAVSRDELERIARLQVPIASIDSLMAEVADSLVVSPIMGDPPEDPAETVDRLAQHQLVEQILEIIRFQDSRGAFVLRCRHGLVTGEPETLDVIGMRLGVTRERVRQIEKQMIELAQEVGEKLLGDPAEQSPLPRRADFSRGGRRDGPAPRRAQQEAVPKTRKSTPKKQSRGPQKTATKSSATKAANSRTSTTRTSEPSARARPSLSERLSRVFGGGPGGPKDPWTDSIC